MMIIGFPGGESRAQRGMGRGASPLSLSGEPLGSIFFLVEQRARGEPLLLLSSSCPPNRMIIIIRVFWGERSRANKKMNYEFLARVGRI